MNNLVIGAGRSGISSAKLLLRNDQEVSIYDGRDDITRKELEEKDSKLSDIDDLYAGKISREEIKKYDRVVISPGIPLTNETARMALEENIPIIGEIELGYLYAKGKIVGITGTNGKTTTTSLTGSIMEKAYPKVFVAGNIGDPFTDIADKTDEDTVTVLEISSFQLETIDRFHVDSAAILNLTPDHLDRHHTMGEYGSIKEKIAENSTDRDYVILNADNGYTKDFGERLKRRAAHPEIILFSSEKIPEKGYSYMDGDIYADGEKILSISDTHLVGKCNGENICSALALARSLGVDTELCVSAAKAFPPVPHRIEFVGEFGGVRYYNDSKATNTDAAIQGIRAMDKKTVLIAGGYDKGSSYDEWMENFDGKVKALVLIGQTAEKIKECAVKHGVENIFLCDSLEKAMEESKKIAKKGENILLSPACASWGMFKNYEERGDLFKKLSAID